VEGGRYVEGRYYNEDNCLPCMISTYDVPVPVPILSSFSSGIALGFPEVGE
jgi:hypothetical protein